MPGSDTPQLHQTVTNPSQAGWNQLTSFEISRASRVDSEVAEVYRFTVFVADISVALDGLVEQGSCLVVSSALAMDQAEVIP